jgi:thiol-disulfide isomerase/thioredoxin
MSQGKLMRRAVLAGAGTLAAGTLAATTLLRKPAGPEVHTAVAEPRARLQALDALIPRDPPAPPPDAVFTDGAGAVRRISDFAGKGLVVNLWATWCVPCVAELPALAALARRVADDGILVLPLSSDRGGAEAVSKFYAGHGIEGLGVWLDPKGDLARAWGARGIPTTLIIDRQGREHARFEGAADWAADASMARVRALVG